MSNLKRLAEPSFFLNVSNKPCFLLRFYQVGSKCYLPCLPCLLGVIQTCILECVNGPLLQGASPSFSEPVSQSLVRKRSIYTNRNVGNGLSY